MGDNFLKFEKSLQQPEQKAIFVNNNKISTSNFKSVVDFSITSLEYEPNGFYVDNQKRGRHPLHHAGAFYVQDPSAMFTVNAIDFAGDECVLDMCAAPGGKSIQIANRIKNGLLVSNEIMPDRVQVLNSNIERMGLTNVVVCCDSPQNIAKAYANCFDVVFVDAPCSGEGMFRRGQEVVDTWNANLPKLCAERQLEILICADKTLRQGGKLVYSTCTYERIENEEVIKTFLNAHNYQPVYINAPKAFSRGVGLKEAVRLYPHMVKGEGQFVCVLKKLGENVLSGTPALKLVEDKNCTKFIKENLTANINTYSFKDNIYYIKQPYLIKRGVNYLNPGVRIGKMEKNRFVPHHQLFSAFGNLFARQLNLSLKDERVGKYLIGDQISTPFLDGFGVVKVEGCALGGFKISVGEFKNYYPKGLRNLKN